MMSPRRKRTISPGTSSCAAMSDQRPVTLDPRMRRKLCLQRSNGVACLILLPKPHDGVGEEQHDDDDEVRPVLHDSRQHGRGLDHPGNRPPEIAEEFEDGVDLSSRQARWARIGQASSRPRPGSGLCRARRRASLRAHRGKAISNPPDRRTWFQTSPPGPPCWSRSGACFRRRMPHRSNQVPPICLNAGRALWI